ncbi:MULTISPECIES: hypothetical protein [Herbaspirillum]|uniref:hypothetical protein n=1 Tax=Herbaspirillum TaxID=963 RepID=UPI002176E8E7|nr:MULTISPECIES: hypothetical protein [Herbaspirillum]UWE19318.1 hypothetical protein NY669_26950 [Herbaspirillum huttiense]|tara:strand:- start:97 stop:261 length:165 start_codon:yes stop_codon:yes gene_type:complete
MKIRAFITFAVIAATLAVTGCSSTGLKTSLKDGESYSFGRDCKDAGLCGGGGSH